MPQPSPSSATIPSRSTSWLIEEANAGLYLHGININIPEFMTYPSQIVQKFAEDWGFIKTGLIIIDNITEVKAFLEEVAETGAHDGRDVEGFVVRCKMSPTQT